MHRSAVFPNCARTPHVQTTLRAATQVTFCCCHHWHWHCRHRSLGQVPRSSNEGPAPLPRRRAASILRPNTCAHVSDKAATHGSNGSTHDGPTWRRAESAGIVITRINLLDMKEIANLTFDHNQTNMSEIVLGPETKDLRNCLPRSATWTKTKFVRHSAIVPSVPSTSHLLMRYRIGQSLFTVYTVME